MTGNALTCRELVELVTDYFEDALPAVQRQRFEEHISRCSGCDEYLRQMHLTILATGGLSEDQLSEAARTELLHLFRDWKQSSS